MAARDILFIIIAIFFAVALLQIYNAYYDPVSTSGTSLPAVADQ